MTHVNVQVVAASVARAIQHFLKMLMTGVKVECLGRKTSGESSGQRGTKKTLGFTYDAVGDCIRHKQRITFQRGRKG